MVATQAVFGFVSELGVLYLLRVLSGAATAGMLVASTAYVADSTTEDDRASGMAWFGAAMSLGLVAGPALGGLLTRPGLALEAGAFRLDGYSLPFVSAAALAGVVLVAARRSLPESSVGCSARHRLRAALAVAPDRRRLHQLLGLVVASQFGLALFEGTFALYARNRLDLGPAGVSLAFTVCGLIMGGMQLFAVRALARVIRPMLQVSSGLVLMGAGSATLVLTRSFPAVLALIAVFALGMALVTPNLSALISGPGGPGTGTALGLKSAAGNIGQFIGPLLGGLLLEWRPTSPFLVSGIVLGITGSVVGLAQSRQGPDGRTER
jgi:DHA1 family multidrug resistance protein-like MFS transporter